MYVCCFTVPVTYTFEGFYVLVHNMHQSGCSLPLRFTRANVDYTAQLVEDHEVARLLPLYLFFF